MAFMMTVAAHAMKINMERYKDRNRWISLDARQESGTGRVICRQWLKMWREKNAIPIAPCAKHCQRPSLKVWFKKKNSNSNNNKLIQVKISLFKSTYKTKRGRAECPSFQANVAPMSFQETAVTLKFSLLYLVLVKKSEDKENINISN